MSDQQLHLNVFVLDVGHHEAAWRLPESEPDAVVSFDHYLQIAREAERGALDAVFFADSPRLLGDPALRPSATFDPTILLAALATGTTHIGLIGTVSTTYTHPYDVARRFSTLDHISGGRVGWNIVTTTGADSAQNFGLRDQPAHADRYARAEEYVSITKRLWDSWGADAVVADKAQGIFADATQIAPIDHEGDIFQVAGPLNISRSPQRHPLLVQAGTSPAGRAFASRHANAIFSMGNWDLADAQEFYSQVKSGVADVGRDPAAVAVLPGVVMILGDTESQAHARAAELAELTNPSYGLTQLKAYFEQDFTASDLDRLFTEVWNAQVVEGLRGIATSLARIAAVEHLTVRDLIGRLANGRGHRVFIGTPEQFADDLETWYRSGAADGFNLMPSVLPSGLTEFVDHVVPLLRSRGLFRDGYHGSTLRDHYGLRSPAIDETAAFTTSGAPGV